MSASAHPTLALLLRAQGGIILGPERVELDADFYCLGQFALMFEDETPLLGVASDRARFESGLMMRRESKTASKVGESCCSFAVRPSFCRTSICDVIST
jgi:hypothetical protein